MSEQNNVSSENVLQESEDALQEQAKTIAAGIASMMLAQSRGIDGKLSPFGAQVAELELKTGKRMALIENRLAKAEGAIGVCVPSPREIKCAPALRDGKAHYRCKLGDSIAGALCVRVKQAGKETEYSLKAGESPDFACMSDTAIDFVFDEAPESVSVVCATEIDDASKSSIFDWMSEYGGKIADLVEKVKEIWELIESLIAAQESQNTQIKEISDGQIKSTAGCEGQIQNLVVAGELLSADLKKMKNIMIAFAKAIEAK